MAKRTIKRPFRIWDEKAKQPLPWRCYSSVRRAISKALELAKWDLPMHGVYSVYNKDTQRLEYQIVKRIVDGKTALVERA